MALGGRDKDIRGGPRTFDGPDSAGREVRRVGAIYLRTLLDNNIEVIYSFERVSSSLAYKLFGEGGWYDSTRSCDMKKP